MKKLFAIILFSVALWHAGKAAVTNDLWVSLNRSPILAVAPNGTLLAFEEHRFSDWDSGRHDIVLKRSADNGQTWTPEQTVATDGANCFSDATVTVDSSNGKIFLITGWNLYGDTESSINDGTSVDTRHIVLVSSTDSGTNWSSPVDITASVKSPGWRWYASGPGRGIQLSTGRLLVPCYHTGASWDYYPNAIYSDDHGTTWNVGGGVTSPVNYDECAFVELTNGAVMMNVRNDRGEGRRGIGISSDAGATWSSVTNDATLLDPGCEGSFYRYTQPPGYYKSRLLFSNPADTSSRQNLTIRLSYDDGATWAVSKTYCSTLAGYSSVVVLTNGNWAVLFENGTSTYFDKTTFISDTLANLTGGADSLDPQTNPPPVLNITSSGSNVLLSWAVSAPSFLLQQNPDLSPTNWSTFDGVGGIQVTNGQNFLWLLPTNAARYFRLKSP